MLPPMETPAHTEGYEGFFHLTDMAGTVERATLSYIVRDHHADIFEALKGMLRRIEQQINARYGEGTVELTVTDSYRNMLEQIQPHMHLVDNAKLAAERAGVTPTVEAIRGGTDGARLSFMGLPCPNLGTGGYAFHGPYEHITAEGMDIATDILINLVKLYAEA
jgi:tripeptide aminopeptidase